MAVERRGPAVCNDSNKKEGKGDMTKTPGSLQDLRRSLYIKAKAEPAWRFWGLYVHVCKMETLQEAYCMAKKNDGAPGIDGVTFEAIEQSGEESFLQQIRDELVSNTYRPMRARKKEIPKDGGTKVRVLSIPSIRDRVVQGALKLILEPIFEADFQPGSYGYRPKRTAHEAVYRVAKAIDQRKTRVIDLDLRAYFDEIQHDWLLKFVKHRIADRRILRLIGKWLRAGVSEEGQWSKTERGTPQGSVASPLLANVYLHYAFDLWVQHWRQHRATGEMIVVRYADDAVLGFQHRADAEQFLRDWKERLGRFGLELHPDKTRLIEFGRYAVANRKERGEGKPETFNFLGFTHICGQTWKTGKFQLLRKTIHQRLSVKLRALKEELRRRKHLSLAELGKWLRSVVQGYFNYHAVPGNLASLRSFRLQVIRRWMRALRRRSQKSRMTWPRLVAIAVRWLPQPSILHPYPNLRFDAKHPR